MITKSTGEVDHQLIIFTKSCVVKLELGECGSSNSN
jgi:hypothetical protein